MSNFPCTMEKGNEPDTDTRSVREGLERWYHPSGTGHDHVEPPTFDGEPTPQYLAGLAGYTRSLENEDLNNPCVSYYGRLRFYSLQHTCQELNHLSKKTLEDANATWHDLERLRHLLHEHGKCTSNSTNDTNKHQQPQ